MSNGNSYVRLFLVTLVIAVVWSGPLGAETPQTYSDWPDADFAPVQSSDVSSSELTQLAPPPDTAMWLAEGEGEHPDHPAAAVPAPLSAAPAGCGSSVGWLDVTVDGTWTSKYMYRGFDILDDSSAYQPSVDIQLGDTGLAFNIWTSYASHDRDHDLGGSDRGDWDEYDYTLYYSNSLCDCVDIETGVTYYDFPDWHTSTYDNIDWWEWYGTATLSSCPLSPYLTAYYGWPDAHDDGGADLSGWMLTSGVSHSVPLCGLNIDLYSDIWYINGEYGFDPGWSHCTFGASTDIDLCGGLTFTPGIHYQVMIEDDVDDDAVNEDDELWTTLSLAYNF